MLDQGYVQGVLKRLKMAGLADIVPGCLPTDIKKTILVLGRSNHRLEFSKGTKIIFHFKAFRTDESDKILDDTRNMKSPMEIYLGKQFKLEIWEVLLKSMTVNEVSSFKVPKKYVKSYPIVSKVLRDAASPHKHTSPTCCGLMKDTCGYKDLDELLYHPVDLTFIFDVIGIEGVGEFTPETWILTDEDKLASVAELRESGNTKFKAGDVTGAKTDYALAIGRIEHLMQPEKPGSSEFGHLQMMKVPFLLNYCLCLMKEGEYYEAIPHLTSTIAIDPENSKAFFRRAKCHQSIGNFSEAKNDYKTAVQLEPALDKCVEQELDNLEKARKKNDLEDKNRYNKLFG